MKLRVIFPCNPLDRKSVDPEYQGEYAAVKLLGGEIRLFDFDDFRKAVAKFVTAEPGSDDESAYESSAHECFPDQRMVTESGEWLYRGWMMSPVEYEYFEAACQDFGIKLINSATQYSMCHMFPLAYSYVKSHAIDTYVQEEPGDEFDYESMRNYFENKYGGLTLDRKLFVKDWVKSAKGTEGATIIEDWNDEATTHLVVDKMRGARGKLFNEGYVFKKFVNFKMRPDGNPVEWRAFFVYDKLVSFSPTYGPGGDTLAPPQWLIDIAANVPSDFYTIDIGMTNDGELVIIETGDGGVSGLSPNQMPITFYSSILARLEEHQLVK